MPPTPPSAAETTRTPTKTKGSKATEADSVAANMEKLRIKKEENERRLREKEEQERLLREEEEKSIAMERSIADAAKTLKEITKRKDAIVEIHKQVKDSASVDLLFLVDCTGSMSPFIVNIRNRIVDSASEIKRIHSQLTLRLAFVGYRDHTDGVNRLSILPFTQDASAFKEFVRGQSATGGDDECEDVHGGMNAAANLEWASQTRILFHVGDAPAHGTEFHNGCNDRYPTGDPNGLNAKTLLESLRSKNILYSFGRINHSTDKMVRRFNELVGAPYVTQQSVEGSTLMEKVTKSVSVSVSRSVSSSARTKDKKAKKDVVLDPAKPSFTSLPTEKAQRFNLTLPASIAELTAAVEDRCIENWAETSPYSFKVAPRPFAKGATRAAYYAQLIKSGRSEDIILKESLYSADSELTKQKYEGFLACQRAAIFLANQFNAAKPIGTPSIRFCDTYIVQFMDRPKQPYMIVEENINGQFEKFNSNAGFCAPCPTEHGTNHDVVQAFSHWTYQATGGNILVVDCQGAFDRSSNTFMLTDPAVHCKSVLRFGTTNMGSVGFQDFFKGHVCNGTCTAMRLTAKPL